MESFTRYLQFQKELTENNIKTIDRFLKSSKPKPIVRTSKANIVENVLRVAGRPLHISNIIEIAERDYGVQLARDSIVSILIKKINAGQKFIRTAPNTFSLKK